MKRKVIVLLLASALVFGSCSTKPEETSSETKKPKETTEEVTEETTAETSEVTTEETTIETTEETSETLVVEETVPDETEEVVPEETEEGEFNYKAYLKEIDYSGSVLVARDDEVYLTYSFGDARIDYETGEVIKNNDDTVFEMGSITKQFTAVAIMQLEEQELLSTEDTMDKYIPEYAYADKITIHQLLNMTSGVVDYITGGPLAYDLYGENFEGLADISSLQDITDMYLDVCEKATTPITFEELLDMVQPYELHFEPGTKYEYSNTNYYFLGEIIERITGEEYDAYVREHILEPLELTELWPDIDHLTSDGCIKIFGIGMPVPHQDSTISYAVGVMTGTTNGLLQWERHVLEGALLTEESWNKIFDGGEFGYGYGWNVNDNLVSHSGMTLGYNAFVLVDRCTNTVVIALSNTQSAEFGTTNPSSSTLGMTLYENIDKIIE